ncbi:MAG: protein-glutamate O-methyltransferase CheR [Nitrospinae bacterium]|nr:protein-glutamate O-methyltransferase CheR [Nitrospinota bacterium]
MAFQMSEEELALLTGYIRDHTGLVFSGPQEHLFHRRVKKRIDANMLQSAREYYHFIRFDPKRGDEMRELINLITVNETYFFRETPQMALFKEELLPLLKEKNRREKTLRIWSAACSNGAEPYSIAILIKESGLFDGGDWRVDLYGTDINAEVVQAARLGLYNANAFRGIDEAIREKYFSLKEPGVWELDPGIRRMVHFSLLNLYNPAQIKLMRNMDVILCRNVMIYFDAEGKKRVSEHLYEALRPLGCLVIGQSESLFKVTTFYKMAPMGNVLVYQRPAAED